MNSASPRFVRLWRIGFVLLVGGWLGWILFDSESIRQLPKLIHSPGAWWFLISWAALPIGLALLWRWQLICVSGIRIPLSSAFRVQGLAWAGRYLPGKAGLWIAKVAVARSQGIAASRLTATVLAEQLLFLLAGTIVGALTLCWSDVPGTLWAFLGDAVDLHSGRLLLAVVLGAAAMLGVAAIFLSAGARKIVRARLQWVFDQLPAPFQSLQLLIAHGLLHIIVGIGLFVLLQQLLPESASALGLVGIVGALAISNVAGIAAVFAPAGLGVRELVLAGLLAINGNFEAALAAAVLVRAITLIADAAFSALAIALGGAFERVAARAPH